MMPGLAGEPGGSRLEGHRLSLVEEFEEAPYDMVGNWETAFLELFANAAIAHAIFSRFEQRVFVR
jgi:hypothetical protein